ncbi:hypothetical protein Tco_0663538 [Tanacetum coccineum]
MIKGSVCYRPRIFNIPLPPRFGGVIDWYQSQVMSSASSAVTYTSVYTDSEPGRVFWGADEEPVAPPSPDYIPDSKEPQTPPVPQDEDEREPMFIQPHDPDYPLPPVDSPTTESPGYVTESDPEEDPEEYEDDKIEDGPVDYPMDEGDDDDDDGDSFRDDADEDEDDEDEDEEEEDEEHLAPADSAIVVPVDEPTSISLSPEAEVERLLAMTTPSLSPPISLSPPSRGERLDRSIAPPAHSSLPLAHSSPLLPLSGCPTQIQTLGIASTQALIDAVTAALPSPPLPLLPSSLYEIRESSTAKPIEGRGVDYGFVQTVDAEARQQGISEVGYGIRDTWVDPAEAVLKVAPMTVGEVNTRVTELVELHKHDTQDLYALLEDAQDSRSRISQRVDMDSQRVDLLMRDRMTLQEMAVHYELQTYREQVHETRSQMQQAEMAELRETNRRRQAHMIKTLHMMRDMRREMGDMQAELLALREQRRRARQPAPNARVPDHQDASRDADSYI